MLLKKEKKRKIPFTIIGLSDRVRKLTQITQIRKNLIKQKLTGIKLTR